MTSIRNPQSAIYSRVPYNAPRSAPPVYRYTRQFLQQEVGNVRRATWGPRLVAALADFLIVAVPFNAILSLIYWLQQTFLVGNATDAQPGAVLILLPLWLQLFLLMSLFSLYLIVANLRWETTLGKRWMNLRVVNDDGESPTRRNLFIRYSYLYIVNLPFLVYIVVNFIITGDFGLYIAVAALLADFGVSLADPQNKTLHDRLAHTQVIVADLTKI